MIYKCNNCGRTYNLKQEFCECGNNVFYEVVENFDYSKVKTDFNSENEVDFLYANSHNNSEKNYQNEQDYSLNEDLKKQRTSEFVAIAVFVIVLLSAISVIFLNAYKLINKGKDITATVEIENYIPSDVNEFWQENKSATKEATPQKTTRKQNDNTNSVKQMSRTKSDKKSIQKKSPDIQTQKNLSQKTNNSKLQNTNSVNNQNNEQSENLTNKKTTSNNVEEYLKYKNNLRNKLFANFPILTVQGQGSAKVAFAISSDGKLTNRKFVSQSGNKSLDDAMYHMLMRVPVYNAPPTGFENQEIIMQMDFNNGHYSFAFIN